MDLIKSITQEYERTDIPEFSVGDTVKVYGWEFDYYE